MSTSHVREYRALSRAISDASGNRVKGYFAKFNTLSEDLGGFKETLAKGCFTKSLRDNPDVLALFNHSTSDVLGRVSAGTLEVKEDTIGLAFTLELPDTTVGRDLKVSMQRGDVSQCSFGFFCVRDQWSALPDGTPLRTVIEAVCFEGSIVPMPAYQDTEAKLRAMFPDGRTHLKRDAGDAEDPDPDNPDSDFDLDDVIACEDCSLCAAHRCANTSSTRNRQMAALLLRMAAQ